MNLNLNDPQNNQAKPAEQIPEAETQSETPKPKNLFPPLPEKVRLWAKRALWMLTGVSLLCFLFAVLFNTDGQTHYFDRGAFLPTVSYAFAFLAALLGICDAAFENGLLSKAEPISEKHSLLPLFGVIGSVLLLLLDEATKSAFFLLFNQRSSLTLTGKIQVGTVIFLTLSVTYFVLCLICDRKTVASVPVWFGMSGILGGILAVSVYHFDAATEMNAPIKVLTQLAVSVSVLYLASDVRFFLGTGNGKLLRAGRGLLFTLVPFSAVGCIVWILKSGEARFSYLAGWAFALGIFFAALTKVFSKEKVQKVEETVIERTES